MAGYSRQDTLNNIANGNVIDADDFDAEYNALEGAFNATTGHAHDGTAGEGAPIVVTGPSQQFEYNANALQPAAGQTSLDIGLTNLPFDNIFVNTVRAGANKRVTITDNEYDVSSGNLHVDVAADILLDTDSGIVTLQDGGVAYAGLEKEASTNNLVIKSGTTTAATFTGANVDLAGTLDVTGATTLDSTLAVVGAAGVDGDFDINTNKFTVASATGNTAVAGTLDVTGATGIDGNFDVGTTQFTVDASTGNTVIAGTLNVTGAITGSLTGAPTSLSGLTTDDLSVGSSNLYFTNALARGAVSVTDSGGDGSLAYDSSTGVITYTGPSASEVRAHISAGEGIDISSGEISGEDASSSNKGIAKFNATHFTVADGNVSLTTDSLKDIVGEMVSGNTESGLSVTYVSSDHTLDFSLTKDPSITLTGAVTGSGTMTNLGNVSIATTATADPTLTLTGDVTGSATFTNLGNASLSATIAANAVTANEIANNAVGSSEIAADAVGTSEIDDDAVTEAKIASNAVKATQLYVSGNGSTSQFLRSDGDGTFTWATPAGTNTFDADDARAAQHASGGYAGKVGQYRFARSFSGGAGTLPNSTQTGGNLGPADAAGNAYKNSSNQYVVLGGSWRRMGYQHGAGSLSTGSNVTATTLYVRYA